MKEQLIHRHQQVYLDIEYHTYYIYVLFYSIDFEETKKKYRKYI